MFSFCLGLNENQTLVWKLDSKKKPISWILTLNFVKQFWTWCVYKPGFAHSLSSCRQAHSPSSPKT